MMRGVLASLAGSAAIFMTYALLALVRTRIKSHDPRIISSLHIRTFMLHSTVFYAGRKFV
jgi:hypothetical protein